MKSSLLGVALVVAIGAVLTTQAAGEKALICYYSSWAYVRPGNGNFDIDNIDPNLCTHLVYAFIGANWDGSVRVMDPWNDLEEDWGKGGFKRFNALRDQNPKLKTLIAIGGWNEGSKVFSHVTADASIRSNFVNNLYNFVKQHNFNGLDVDWEYPAQRDSSNPLDKQNFALLCKELSQKFKPQGLLLTAAVSAAISSVEISYDIPEMVKYLDYINMMSYDYHGSWESTTGIVAPMFPSFVDSDMELNTDATIQYWLKNGCPAEKLLLGIPTYGRSFMLEKESSPGLGANTIGPGVPGPYSGESGFLGYNEICELQYPGYWSINWAAQQKVPFAFKGKLWVGYENRESVKIKVDYAKQYGLGGVLVWGIETDDFKGVCKEGPYPLINAVKESLN